MSQVYKAGVSGTPSVPTSFTTDQVDSTTAALGAPLGTVVPQGNVLRIGGNNGVATFSVTNQPGALEIGFIQGAATTTDGVTVVPVLTQPTVANSTLVSQIIVAGFCTAGTAANSSIGAYATVVINNTAGTARVVGTVDFIKNADVSLDGATLTVTVSGSNFIVNVIGVTGQTILWEVALPGIVVG